MEPEKKRVSSQVRVEATRPERDPKTRKFSDNLTWTRPQKLKFVGLPDSNLTRKPDIFGFLKMFYIIVYLVKF